MKTKAKPWWAQKTFWNGVAKGIGGVIVMVAITQPEALKYAAGAYVILDGLGEIFLRDANFRVERMIEERS